MSGPPRFHQTPTERNSILKTIPHHHFRDSGRFAAIPFGTALIAGLCLCACKKPEVTAPPPPIVEVMEISTSEVPLTSTLIGQLDSPQNVEVRARVEAFVEETPFIEGTEVQQDQVIFKLDKKPFTERLNAAEGSLAEAKAALAKYKADVARLTPLYQKNAIPKQDLDNALASVEVGEAGVQSANARVDSAKLDLGYCDVKAPITGLIGAKQVSIGDLVGRGEPTLLATISTLDPIWFYCNVSEVDYIRATERSHKMGTKIESLPLTLILSDGKKLPDQGHFVFIDRAVDVKTGTLRIRAEFPNKDKLLRPGMFARARVDIGTRKNCIAIPERAILELQGKSFVWVVNANGIANQRAVTRGEQDGSDVIIPDGLKVGERIILEGLQKAREGAPVNVQTAAAKSAPAAKPETDKE